MRQARYQLAGVTRQLSPVPEESFRVRLEKKVDFTKPVIEPDNIFGGPNFEKDLMRLQDRRTDTEKATRSCLRPSSRSVQLSIREAGKFTICNSVQLHKIRKHGGKVSRKAGRKHESIWRNLKTIAGGVADLAIDIADIGQEVLSWVQKSLGYGKLVGDDCEKGAL